MFIQECLFLIAIDILIFNVCFFSEHRRTMIGAEGRDPIWVLGGSYHPPKGQSTGDILDMIGQSGTGAPLTGAALTVALDVVQAWAVLITLGFTLILFFFLAFCVCAKKDDG